MKISVCLARCQEWYYPDDGSWCASGYSTCCNAQASAQSPINVHTASTVQSEEPMDLLDRLTGDYDMDFQGYITNDGHSGKGSFTLRGETM